MVLILKVWFPAGGTVESWLDHEPTKHNGGLSPLEQVHRWVGYDEVGPDWTIWVTENTPLKNECCPQILSVSSFHYPIRSWLPGVNSAASQSPSAMMLHLSINPQVGEAWATRDYYIWDKEPRQLPSVSGLCRLFGYFCHSNETLTNSCLFFTPILPGFL